MPSRFGGYEDIESLAEFYDPVYEERRRHDIDFFVGYSRQAVGRTLELGCGTGRVLIPTAAAGCDITGLDLSSHMLRKCRETLSLHPEEVRRRVRLIEGNMTDFDTGETYSLVTTPFRPFQHLISSDEQRACLSCANRHLVHHGLLILDVFHPIPTRLVPYPGHDVEVEDTPEMLLPDGRRLRRTFRTTGFHRHEQHNDIELIYYVTHPDGRQERHVQAFPFRYFYRYEVEHLLELCGFAVVGLFGDFDHSQFSNDSPEMVFVAEKTREA